MTWKHLCYKYSYHTQLQNPLKSLYVYIFITCCVLLHWIKVGTSWCLLNACLSPETDRRVWVRFWAVLPSEQRHLRCSAQKKHLVFQLVVFLSHSVWCGLPLITQHAHLTWTTFIFAPRLRDSSLLLIVTAFVKVIVEVSSEARR